MGTSTHNSGQNGRTPLVPSWLEEPSDTTSPSINTENPIGIPPDGAVDRFTKPRRDFTIYINSNGRDRSRSRKSISNYIKQSLGGSSNAVKRLGSARLSSANLLSIARALHSGGVGAVEQYLNITNLAGKTASDVFITIVDFICPDGGTQDEGIAREAYISAIEETPEIADVPFDELTVDQMLLFIEKTMTNAICARITNDIGNKLLFLPNDIETANTIVIQITDLISGAISDAITELHVTPENIPQNEAIKIIDEVYKTAFDILESIGDKE